jgi:hypoxanthine phosphoribosyltransferase
MKRINFFDKEFEVFITQKQIEEAVDKIALQLNSELGKKDVIFLSILNGSFMFAADLFKEINFPSQITFLKLASYSGTSSTGKVKKLIGFNEEVEGKIVVIIEDIVDTGNTLTEIINHLTEMKPAEIKIATLFLKPEIYKKEYPIDYIGMEIPNKFVIGYGLDINGYGRNLKDLYALVEC